jgi:Holliday junction DNA helicase RuvA
MIGSLHGTWRNNGNGWVVVDRSGVGWVVVPTCAPVDGAEVDLFVSTEWGEASGPRFFAHASTDARDLFDVLRSVHGIGGTTAAGIIEQLGVAATVAAVVAQDAAAFKPVKGVGPKTAVRILSDAELPAHLVVLADTAAPAPVMDELAATLTGLGFPEDAALNAVSSVRARLGDVGEDEILSEALSELAA